MFKAHASWLVLGVLLLGAGASKAEDDRPDSPEDYVQVYKKLLAEFKAPKVTAHRIDGSWMTENKNPKERFHNYPLLERKDADAKLYPRVAELLLEAKTYNTISARCFQPGLAFRLEENGKTLDLIFCLHCQHVEYHLGDERHMYPLSDAGNEAFKKIYFELFPEQAKK
ncbi:MAG: hypothetical protein M5U26_24115 [Planctomycetota bacterium]|nr:hypothetical protein [Planctomycetota bacterium]